MEKGDEWDRFVNQIRIKPKINKLSVDLTIPSLNIKFYAHSLNAIPLNSMIFHVYNAVVIFVKLFNMRDLNYMSLMVYFIFKFDLITI